MRFPAISNGLRCALAVSLMISSAAPGFAGVSADVRAKSSHTARMGYEALSVSARFSGGRMLSRAPRALHETLPQEGRGARMITLGGLTPLQEAQLSATIPSTKISHAERVALATLLETNLNDPITYRDLPLHEIPVAGLLAREVIDLLRQPNPVVRIGPTRYHVEWLWTPKNIPFTIDHVTVHAFAVQRSLRGKGSDGTIRIHFHDAAGLLHDTAERALAPQHNDIDSSQYHHYGQVLELLAGYKKVQLNAHHVAVVPTRVPDQIQNMSQTSRYQIQKNQSAAIDRDSQRFPFGTPSDDGMRKYFMRFSQGLSVLAARSTPPAQSIKVVETATLAETETWLARANGYVKLSEPDQPDRTESIPVDQARTLLGKNQIRCALWSDGYEGLVWHGQFRSATLSLNEEFRTVDHPSGDLTLHVGPLEYIVKHTPTEKYFLIPKLQSQSKPMPRKTYWPIHTNKTYTVGADRSDFEVAEMGPLNARFSFIVSEDRTMTGWSAKITNLSDTQPIELAWTKLPRIIRRIPKRMSAWAPMALSASTYAAFQTTWDSLNVQIGPWVLGTVAAATVAVLMKHWMHIRRDTRMSPPSIMTARIPVTPVIFTQHDTRVTYHDANEPESREFLTQWRPRAYGSSIQQAVDFNLELLLNHLKLNRNRVAVESQQMTLPPLDEIQRTLDRLPQDSAYIFLNMRMGPSQFERAVGNLDLPKMNADVYAPHATEPGAIVIRRMSMPEPYVRKGLVLVSSVVAGIMIYKGWDAFADLFSLPVVAAAVIQIRIPQLENKSRTNDLLRQLEAEYKEVRYYEALTDPLIRAEQLIRSFVRINTILMELPQSNTRLNDYEQLLARVEGFARGQKIGLKLRIALNDFRGRTMLMNRQDKEARSLFMQELRLVKGLMAVPPRTLTLPGWEFSDQDWEILQSGKGPAYDEMQSYLHSMRVDINDIFKKLRAYRREVSAPLQTSRPAPAPDRSTLKVDLMDAPLARLTEDIKTIQLNSSQRDPELERQLWIQTLTALLELMKPGLLAAASTESDELTRILYTLYAGATRKKLAPQWDKHRDIKSVLLGAMIGVAATSQRLHRYPEAEQALKVAATFTTRDNPQLLEAHVQLRINRDAYKVEEAQHIARVREAEAAKAKMEEQARYLQTLRRELDFWFDSRVHFPEGAEGDAVVEFLYHLISPSLSRLDARIYFSKFSSMEDILVGVVLNSLFHGMDLQYRRQIAVLFLNGFRPYSLLFPLSQVMEEYRDTPVSMHLAGLLTTFFSATKKVSDSELPATIGRLFSGNRSGQNQLQSAA